MPEQINTGSGPVHVFDEDGVSFIEIPDTWGGSHHKFTSDELRELAESMDARRRMMEVIS